MAASLSQILNRNRNFRSILRNPPPFPLFSPFRGPPSPPLYSTAVAAASSRPQEKERGKWSRYLLFLPGAITFGLGTWQILRRQEKIEMLGYRTKRLEMEPILWDRVASLDSASDSLEFRKVVCEGVFDDEKSIFVGPRSRSISGVTENGYYLITPLVPRTMKSDSVQLPILVNRGWVPRGWRNNPAEDSRYAEIFSKTDIQQNKKIWSRKLAETKDGDSVVTSVRVTGVFRGSEKPSIFIPENDPKSGQWFYVDVPMIARACGLPENTLYVEAINDDSTAVNPYPVPKDVNTLIRYSVMPQDHLNYTITWYSLSAAVTFMALKRIRPKKTPR